MPQNMWTTCYRRQCRWVSYIYIDIYVYTGMQAATPQQMLYIGGNAAPRDQSCIWKQQGILVHSSICFAFAWRSISTEDSIHRSAVSSQQTKQNGDILTRCTTRSSSFCNKTAVTHETRVWACHATCNIFLNGFSWTCVCALLVGNRFLKDFFKKKN